ncbi:MAG: putative glycoside hydrolase [Patescibacteria group bacterium]|nr:putative glycoside hydrolase [Patescibacteria group bacterium]
MKKLLKNIKRKNSLFLLVIIISAFFFLPSPASAFFGKVKEDKNPKLANYFLKWEISEEEAKELARWDLLVLDMEVQENSRDNLKKIREHNPDIIILAYISSSEMRYDIAGMKNAKMRKKLLAKINGNWWLTNNQGWRLSAWPNTYMLNMVSEDPAKGASWNAILPNFVYREILSTGLWDGVFYDNIWHDITWLNEGNIDIDRDGAAETKEEINEKWIAGVKKILSLTRDFAGNDFIIMGNGSSYGGYQPYLNGIMFENFPTPWESGGVWSDIMQSYARIKELNFKPNIHIINSNSQKRDNYLKMRSALASALLTDAYFSFDYDISNHSQTWWYDEYGVGLGAAKGEAVRIDGPSADYPQGLWSRGFQNGAVYLNSYFEEARVGLPYQMEKINGEQDKVVNDGGLVSYLILGPTDGIILRDILKIYGVGLLNGKSYKVFDSHGRIAYDDYSFKSDSYLAGERIKENSQGEVSKAQAEASTVDFKNDGAIERVAGAAFGQKSLINIFNNKANKLVGIFSAYPAKFVCGVKTAVGDVDGDGEAEIVTVPAYGGAHLKIFTPYGGLKKEFFFRDKSFRGKYDLVLADTNGDKVKEILVASY